MVEPRNYVCIYCGEEMKSSGWICQSCAKEEAQAEKADN